LLIQASLPGRYWAEGLHTATHLLNRLPTTIIQVACPHLALFGSTPSYEHLRVFGCTCYPNTTDIAPHKLSPHSTRCVFLGYSTDHKGYRYLDLSTNRLIVSRHVIFDEDSFPLATSPSLTDLDFLCESSTVSTIGTHFTTAGTSTPAPHRPAPEIPSGFEPPVAPLPTPAVPPRFLPRAATTAAPPARHLPSQPGRHPVHGRPHRLPTSDGRWEPEPRGHVLGGGCWSPGDMWRPRSCPASGGGSRSHGDTWHPRSCPAPGGGCLSPGNTWRPQSCSEPGGGNRSHGDTWHPQSYPKPGGGSQSRGNTWRP
jgi:hypothetical protein